MGIMAGKISQHTRGFWLKKFKEQTDELKTKLKADPFERAHCQEMALAFMFLYLFVEASVDELVWRILPQATIIQSGGTTLTEYGKYKEKKLSLKGKLEFFFSLFPKTVTFKEFFDLKQKLDSLVKIRNKGFHLEEMSWKTPDDLEHYDSKKEIPIKFAKDLTVKNLKAQVDVTREFIDELKELTNKGFDNLEIDVLFDGVNKKMKFADWHFEQFEKNWAEFIPEP